MRRRKATLCKPPKKVSSQNPMEPNSLEASLTCNLAGIMRSIVSIDITRQDRALRTRGPVNGDRRTRRGGSSIRTRQTQVVIFEYSLASAFNGPKAKSQKKTKKTLETCSLFQGD